MSNAREASSPEAGEPSQPWPTWRDFRMFAAAITVAAPASYALMWWLSDGHPPAIAHVAIIEIVCALYLLWILGGAAWIRRVCDGRAQGAWKRHVSRVIYVAGILAWACALAWHSAPYCYVLEHGGRCAVAWVALQSGRPLETLAWDTAPIPGTNQAYHAEGVGLAEVVGLREEPGLVAHGPLKVTTVPDHRPVADVMFAFNVMHGPFVAYSPESGVVRVQGEFTRDAICGHWTYRTEAGDVLAEEDIDDAAKEARWSLPRGGTPGEDVVKECVHMRRMYFDILQYVGEAAPE